MNTSLWDPSIRSLVVIAAVCVWGGGKGEFINDTCLRHPLYLYLYSLALITTSHPSQSSPSPYSLCFSASAITSRGSRTGTPIRSVVMINDEEVD